MASPKPVRPWLSNAVLVVPLLLVNTVAVYGQVQWALENLADSLVVAVGFALAVESIGVYLAAEAHRALLAGDASLRLRLGSYGVGVLAGTLNYAHFAPQQTQAVVFGVLSAISPVLWAIRSRSLSRDRLRALNLIDGRAVKFTAAQWMLYPGESFRAFRAAVWAGVTNPAAARALVDRTPTIRITVVSLPGSYAPVPQALPGDLGARVLPAVAAAQMPIRRAAITAPAPGRQRIPAAQHPLFPEWLADYRDSRPWSDEVLMQRLGEGTTLPAARSRRQRWEREAAKLSLST